MEAKGSHHVRCSDERISTVQVSNLHLQFAMDEKYDLMHHPAISHSSLGGAAPYIHHGSKPSIYTGRPLFRVGSTENLNPLKEEFH